MRLKNTKQTAPLNLIDQSWVQPYVDWTGERVIDQKSNTFFQNPSGWLTPDEVSMIRSGASFDQIMFRRALATQGKNRSLLGK